jgi:tetratricopeptide (TPR) repeat protein
MTAQRAHELMRAGRLPEALDQARRAVAGATRCLPAHALLVTILVNLDRGAEAAAAIDAIAALPGVDAATCDALAHASMRLGRHQAATVFYARATQLAPRDAGLWYNLATAERALGRLDRAEAACEHAIACDPAHSASYLLRADLRVQTPDRNHVDQLRAVLGRLRPDSPARSPLNYALAKELDDLGDYDAAFAAFADAGAARRRAMAYDVATDEAKLARIAQVFDEPLDDTAGRDGGASPFVFILGLPRSGTTLLERMLSNLPGVASNGETDHFSRALLRAAPPQGSDVFARAALADPGAVGAGYAAAAARPDAATVIEKLPMNYLYLGAIRRALPEAGLLVLRRSPLDSCFAMYRTLFGDAYPFSYDFDDLARYFAAYARLMTHWRDRLGGALHDVAYEDLVTDPARHGGAAAAHCRLAWQDAATAIETNRAASMTASAAQIRRPIYTSSLDRLAHYRRHLDPLAQALERHGIPT